MEITKQQIQHWLHGNIVESNINRKLCNAKQSANRVFEHIHHRADEYEMILAIQAIINKSSRLP